MSDSAAGFAMLRGALRVDEPMGAHNTWRAGGRARRYARPADLDDLRTLLAALPRDEAILWLGLGSNLLVRDGGFAGTVIATQSMNTITPLGAGRFRVEAGAACNKVARVSARAGCVGAEFLAGIPGTMGGALAMNAGAWGDETWPLVTAVDTIDRDGYVHRRDAREFRYAYRHVEGPVDLGFVACELRVPPGDTVAAQARIKDLLARRAATQPTGQPSCGSVFRNPTGDHAARLIEAAGLKGHCRGAACVSGKHANFIINTGDAAADDIEDLLNEVRDIVSARFGVELRPEVRIVGSRAGNRSAQSAGEVPR